MNRAPGRNPANPVELGELTDPHLLRATFDDAPELYDRVRPVPPRTVFDDLVSSARLEPGASLLEIGCGTGQATLPLAERGFEVVAIELGEHLADFTRRKLAGFERVRIVTSSFEAWDPEGECFDAVVCFNAFHWIDRELRFAKPAQVLRERGTLCIVAMEYVMPDDPDPVWSALQEDYDAVLGPSSREAAPRHPGDVVDRSDEIAASGHFRDVTARRTLWNVSFSADDYIALLKTSSWHRKLDAEACQRLLRLLHRRISVQPDRTVRPTLLATVYVAERA